MLGPLNTQTLRAAVALLAALVVAPQAWAGGRLPCHQARVFSGAAVNALVLPYRYEKPRGSDPRVAGARLAALIQQETLFAMLKYGSVGATELVSEDGKVCDVREVLERIASGPVASLRPRHAVALIWGRIYEEKADLYVQSYVRFLRLDETESIEVTLPGAGGLSLRARLPAQATALAPRKLAVRDLEEIERRSQASLVLHRRPGADRGTPLADSPVEPLTYGVIAAEGDWMKIRNEITGKEGWVRARLDDDAWALRRLMPELAYFDAVIGYLRLRTIEQRPLASSPQRLFGWVARAFNAYEEAVGRDAAPEAAGLAKAMMGLLLWTHPEITEGGDGRVRAARMFAEAFERMPGSPEARMLAALTRPLLDDTPATGEKLVAGIDRGLLGALAIDPRNATALANLERLYGFALRNPELSPYSSEQLVFRLGALKSARGERDGR